MGLFKSAWESKNEEKALSAIGKLIDQEMLAQAILEASSVKVRIAAAKELTDKKIILDLINNNSNFEIVQIELLNKISDQETLSFIAKNNDDEYVRRNAVSMLVDINLLNDFIVNGDNEMVRSAANMRVYSLFGKCKLHNFVKAQQIYNWDGCMCTVCGKKIKHEWNGCSCLACGDKRNSGHNIDKCKCTICGIIDDYSHDWENMQTNIKVRHGSGYLIGRRVKCKKCGKTKDIPYDVSV